jgi:hypothetical protein
MPAMGNLLVKVLGYGYVAAGILCAPAAITFSVLKWRTAENWALGLLIAVITVQLILGALLMSKRKK